MFKLLLRSFLSTSGWLLLGWLVVAGSWTQPMDAQPSNSPTAQTSPNTPAGNRKLTVKSDIQEADAQTGIITARGNVQIDYPAQQIYATSNQAQYFTRERRIVLTGNVRVLQNGNTIRGETVTYLIDEGLFVARPASNEQVESVYVVPESTNNNPGSSGTDTPALPTTPSESEASANGNTDDTRDNNPPSLPSMPSESESEESEESVR